MKTAGVSLVVVDCNPFCDVSAIWKSEDVTTSTSTVEMGRVADDVTDIDTCFVSVTYCVTVIGG